MHSAYALANTLYGVEITEAEFEEIALNAWEMIGNKHTRLYRHIGNTVHNELKLPCNCDIIESVHLPLADAQLTDSTFDYVSFKNVLTERYIEAVPTIDDPYYNPGKLAKYKLVNDTLCFDRNFKNVLVVYHGVEVDDTGLPMINDKEMRAIAAYVGYAALFKEGLKKKDSGLIQLAQTISSDWLKFCNAARVPSHFTQNDMDAILDAKVSWNRKSYGKSFKPIR